MSEVRGGNTGGGRDPIPTGVHFSRLFGNLFSDLRPSRGDRVLPRCFDSDRLFHSVQVGKRGVRRPELLETTLGRGPPGRDPRPRHGGRPDPVDDEDVDLPPLQVSVPSTPLEDGEGKGLRTGVTPDSGSSRDSTPGQLLPSATGSLLNYTEGRN